MTAGITVTLDPTTTTITVSSDAVYAGQSVTLTSTVAAANMPTDGTVTFTDGTATLGTADVIAGVASLSVEPPFGANAITAAYSGDGTYWAASISGNASSEIATIAGNGSTVYNGDGASTAASLNGPLGVAVDAKGDIFISDRLNDRVREIKPDGTITTIAGNGRFGSSGDNGPATAAELSYAEGLAVDADGDLFIADEEADYVLEVNTQGIMSIVAGVGSAGFYGDGGPATAAALNNPSGVAVNAAGDVFIADTGNSRIQEVNTSGVISTVAGNLEPGYNGDNIAATSAELWYPEGVAVDGNGNLFIADWENQRIREVNSSGIITTVAGDGVFGYGGDNGAATSAELGGPFSIAIDPSDDLFIADADNNSVREVNASTGVITTVAGNGVGFFSGDNGPATAAELDDPAGIAIDAATDSVFVADTDNNRVREFSPGARGWRGRQLGVLTAPSVTNAITPESTQSTSGLVVTPNAADEGFVADFQITGITGGTLYLNDGVTPVTDGEFITIAQARRA